ncbi:MAG: beta strand repeat-containing protein, partial [Spartobacteria bacterium]
SLMGSNSVLTLSGSNTFTGRVEINNGIVIANTIKNFGTDSSLGRGTNNGAITIGQVGNSGTLRYIGSGDTANRIFQIGVNSGTPAGVDTGGATIENAGSGALVLNAPIFNNQTGATNGVGADRTLTLRGTNTNANTISGIIRDNIVTTPATGTARIGLIKTDTGNWTLSGSNTYSGGTLVSAGTLRATTSANALGSGNLTLAGGVLELANDSATSFNRPTTVSGNTTVRSDRLTAGAGLTHTLGTLSIGAQTLTVERGSSATTGTGTITFGAVTLTGAATFSPAANAALNLGAISGTHNLVFTGSGDTTVSGIIGTSTGTLTKSGTGVLTLSGVNTYIGTTTITAGTLQINGNDRIANGSAVTLGGGTLQASGTATDTMGALDVTSTGIIDMGAGDADLTFASLTGITNSLSITNFTAGTDTVVFTSTTGVTEANLAKITVNGAVSGLSGNNIIEATPAGAPTSVTVTPGNASLTISFVAPASTGGRPITGYKYSLNSGGTWSASTGSTSTSINVPSLNNGQTYNVRVRAVTAFGDGTATASDVSGIPRTTPGAPSITGITPGDGTLSVAFSAPSSDGGNAITNYEYSTNDGNNWTTLSPVSTNSPILISGLNNGTTYTVRIRAVNAAGSGTQSTSSTGTPAAAATAPAAPTSLVATPGDQQLSIAFTPGSDGGATISNYEYSFNNSTWTAFNPVDTSSPVV